MDQLERRVEGLLSENSDYKKRIKNLEESNIALVNQLHKLQNVVNTITGNGNSDAIIKNDNNMP